MPNVRDKQWDEYGVWLLHRVGFHKKNYILLMEELHKCPFEFFIEHDDNRAGDGISLRDEYGAELGFSGVSFSQNCSVLEMLVALAIRIEDEYTGNPEDEHPEKIFWEMICNLKLDQFTDRAFQEEDVYLILKKWITRDFNKNGYGSIFPLKHTNRDQTKVEIWSQMNEYLMENYPF